MTLPHNLPILVSAHADLHETRQRLLDIAKRRAMVLVCVFAFVAITALFRIAVVGLSEPASRNRSLEEALLPKRGTIVDRNGVPLALAFPAYALWYNPKTIAENGSPLVKSPAEVAAELVTIFPDENTSKLAWELASGKPGYLRRRILPEDANRIHALGEPALEFPRENVRFYPQGSMAANVLGFVDADGRGHVGMEKVYNKRLTDRSTRGIPAVLSIDARVQGALEDELGHEMAESEAKGAAGIVLDVNTGEIMALASLPSFNPNHIDEGSTGNIFNRVTNQVYELGSVLKPITIASALDAGVVTDLAQRYPSGVPLKIDGFQIHDSHNFGPSLNVPEALIYSSNIVTAQVGDELGGHRLSATLRALGFDRRPQIELPARGLPLWPNGAWARLTTMTVSFGHGIAVTPLHLATAYAALVNGGIWRPATLIRLEPGQVSAGRRVFTATTSARMRELLRMIVVDGTGKKADADGYRVGGKTGSAEKPSPGGYRHNSLITTFAAVFPMDRPRYVVIAMFDEPKGTLATSGQRTAAWNAAPAVGRIIPRIGPLLGVMPSEDRDIDMSDLSSLVSDKG